MKINNKMRLLICIFFTTCIASCTNLSNRCFEHGCTYVDCIPIQTGTLYQLGGQLYIPAEKHEYARKSELFHSFKGEFPEYRLKETGTTESVFRKVDYKDNIITYTPNSSWEYVDITKAERFSYNSKTKVLCVPLIKDEQVTMRAIYAYPLGVITAIGVDIPMAAAAIVASPVLILLGLL